MYFIPMFIGFYSMKLNTIITFVLAAFVSMLIASLSILWIKIMIFVIVEPLKRVNIIRRKQDSKYIDSKDFIYIRDIPSNYTPALASLLLDQSIEYNKDLIATTLYLINHGYLKEHDNRIAVTDKNTSALMEHELYLLSIYNGETIFFSNKWRSKIMLDASNQGLIKKRSLLTKKDKINLVLNLIAPIAVFIFLQNLATWLLNFDNIGVYIIATLLFISLPIFALFIFVYDLMYALSFMSKDFNLTSKGLKEQEKIAKFKNFLEDFSNIENRKTEEIILWEDYLTFAVSLGVNYQIYWDDDFRRRLNATNNIIKSEIIDEFRNMGS